MKSKTELEVLAEISDKLDRLIAVTAIQGRDEEDQIRILYELGYDSFKIGPLVGLSPDVVRKRKGKLKLRGAK